MLAMQMRTKEDIQTKYGTMSPAEKKMNMKELSVIH